MIKKILLLILATGLSSTLIFAEKVKLIEEESGKTMPVGYSATPILNSPEMIRYLEKTAGNTNEIKLIKSVSDNVGDIRNFFVYNFVDEDFEAVEFKLMSKGSLAQVWCSSEELNNGHLTQDVADSFLVYLETKTGTNSVNPAKGVVAIDRGYFGDPPDKDGDGYLDAFLCDIKDGYDPDTGGGYTAGFFYSVDQYSDLGAGASYRSNERDIIYIDSYPGIFFNEDIEIMGGISTTAHEFQHLIHYNYDNLEYTVVNEGLSENAEYITGLNTRSAYGYLSDVNVPIFQWDRDGDVLDDYSRASLFYNYIGDRFGLLNFKNHVQSTSRGATGIEAGLAASGYSNVTFEGLIHDFHIANIVNDRSLDDKYGYLNPDRAGIWIPEQDAYRTPGNAGDTSSIDLEKGGAAYISFDYVQSQHTLFSFPSNIKVSTCIILEDLSVSIQELTSDVLFDIQSVSTPYKTIHYIMTNTSPSSNEATSTTTSTVSWQINGDKNLYSYEISTYKETADAYWMIPYENSSNVGRFGFSNKYLMPQKGNLLELKLYIDSGTSSTGEDIKVRGEGRLRFAVYSDLNGDPGDILADDTLNFSDLQPEWNVFNVSDWNISFEKNSSIHVVYEVMVPTVNNDINSIPLLMDDGTGLQNVTNVVTAPGQFTPIFTNSATDGQRGVWNSIVYSEVVTNDPVSLQDENIIPEIFSLKQNYPNPFNPETKIDFILPNSSDVTFDIYSLNGQRIKHITLENLSQGHHSVHWNGVDESGFQVASGVYFYKISTKSQSKTMKMLFLK